MRKRLFFIYNFMYKTEHFVEEFIKLKKLKQENFFYQFISCIDVSINGVIIIKTNYLIKQK